VFDGPFGTYTCQLFGKPEIFPSGLVGILVGRGEPASLYISSKIDFFIEIEALPNPTMLFKKQEKNMYISFYQEKRRNRIKTFREISIFQFQFLLRTILDKLLGKTGGIMLHASSVSLNGKGYIFIGNPEAGKSTAARNLGIKYRQLSDDTVVIREIKGEYYLFQTPFIEKNRVAKIARYLKLRGVFFLRKSSHYKIEEVKSKEYIFDRLVKQNLTEERDVGKRIKSLMKFVAKYDNIYRLHFGKNSELLIKLFESFSKELYV
jgi:hypothetical protein